MLALVGTDCICPPCLVGTDCIHSLYPVGTDCICLAMQPPFPRIQSGSDSRVVVRIPSGHRQCTCVCEGGSPTRKLRRLVVPLDPMLLMKTKSLAGSNTWNWKEVWPSTVGREVGVLDVPGHAGTF